MEKSVLIPHLCYRRPMTARPRRTSFGAVGATRCGVVYFALLLFARGAAASAEQPSATSRSVSAATIQAALDGLAEGATYTLPAGRIEGRLFVRRAITLRGDGTTVEATGAAVTLDVPDNGSERLAVLEGVSLVGDVGVRVVRGAVRVEKVRVQARTTGIAVEAAGNVRLAKSSVRCRAGATGVVTAGRLEVAQLRVEGPCVRGLDVSATTLRIVDGRIEGAIGSGIRVVDGRLEADGIEVVLGPGEGIAVFAARSAVGLRRGRFTGGHHGFLARAAEAEVHDVTVERAVVSGLAIVGGALTVRNATLTGPFTHAAITGTDATGVDVEDLTGVAIGRGGVMVIRAPLRVERARLGGGRRDGDGDFGHGVFVVESHARLGRLSVRDVDGAAVYVSGGSGRVDGLAAERVLVALAATLGARVRADDVTLAAGTGAGLVAAQGAVIEASSVSGRARVGRVVCGASAIAAVGSVSIDARVAERRCGDGAVSADGWDALVPP